MHAYRTPGIYYEWLDESRRERLPWRTDIAGFVGIAERGPLHTPVALESWSQFSSIFGQHLGQGFLAYAVEGFFANGGQTCYVVRVADPARARSAWVDLLTADGWPLLRLKALSPGTWAHQLSVSTTLLGSAHFTLTLRLPTGAEERWINLALTSGDRALRDAISALNNPAAGSRLVLAEAPHGFAAADTSLRIGGATGRLQGGADGLATLTPAHLTGDGAPPGASWGLATLEAIDAVSIVLLPDAVPPPPPEPRHPLPPPPSDCRRVAPEPGAPPAAPPAVAPLTEMPPQWSPAETLTMQRALIGHCERLQDRVAILDPRMEDALPQQVLAWRKQFNTSYAALYYPWIIVPNKRDPGGESQSVPPGGFVAGIYARTDRQTGVHKAPANEALLGVIDIVPAFSRARSPAALDDPAFPSPEAAHHVALPPIDDLTHADLNDMHVNVIRPYPGRGVRVSGARTLSDKRLWRYVNVRRLVTMIEEAIDEQTQWTVFEPNNVRLRGDLERVVRSFLRGLWRRGMLDGLTAEAAYSVRCDATLNSHWKLEQGQVICEVGIQPPWPAEFVIVRISKKESGIELIEELEAAR
jgi:uncharacterized protein